MTHASTCFHSRTPQDIVTAGAIAFSFGAMNIFARAVGGVLSDYGQKRMGVLLCVPKCFSKCFGECPV